MLKVPPDSLNIEKEDNGGRSFTILLPTHASYEYDVEQDGDVVNDAVFKRNSAVEDLLGIKLNFNVQDGHWLQKDSFVKTISNDVLSNTGEIDLVSGLLVAVAPSTQEGYYIEGNNLAYCDFSKPWWVSDMYDNFSIEGKLFEFVGDASLTLYKDLAVVYFNKQVFDNNNLEYPYDLVRNGEWTIDKLIELGTATGRDLNGDTKWDVEEDEFGTICERIVVGKMDIAVGEDGFVREGDSLTVAPISEKFVDTYTKIYNFIYKSDNVISLNTHDDGTYKTAQYFAEGRFGMMINFLKCTELIRNMKDDFGIVPMPKYNAEQESYRCSFGTSTSVLLVPRTAKDIDLTSKVMESLCYYSYKDVVPKYYEVALKEKYSRDDDIKEMIEIIRDSATMSFAQFHGQLVGNPLPAMSFTTGETYASAPDKLASSYASSVKNVEKNLEKVIEKYSSIE